MLQEFGLTKKEIAVIAVAFDVYDFQGDNTVDAVFSGNLLCVCDLNPTLRTIKKVVGLEENGKKMLSLADIYLKYMHTFENSMLGYELCKLLTNLK